MSRIAWAAVVAIGLLATAASADDAFTLKLYQSKKGDTFAHEKTTTDKMTILIEAGGQKKEQKVSGGSKDVYTEEVLEKKDGARKATKLTRAYTTAEKTEKGETKERVYAGKTVLIEKKGEKYELSIDGKALTEDEAPDLFKKFNRKKDDEPTDQDLLPTDPIKVGGTWKLDADKSEKYFKALDIGMKADAKKSKIEGKLLKAYKKDGAQYGVLEVTITIIVTEIELQGQGVATAPDSKMVAKVTVDTCIDGTVDFADAKTEMSADITADIPNVGSITFKGTTTGTEKQRAAKK